MAVSTSQIGGAAPPPQRRRRILPAGLYTKPSYAAARGAYDSWPYQRPVILTSLGALDPRSVSDGWIDSNTPAISLDSVSTCVHGEGNPDQQPSFSWVIP